MFSQFNRGATAQPPWLHIADRRKSPKATMLSRGMWIGTLFYLK